ncbi:MAG: ATP-binding cassette domain-containing protein, partial [Rothia sp. (in: high G+C Gram-positive bacteria)]|nr:ATP-binding cassette domain-containing protein [Rothia sp. (in: high G+C Gram-positive bacteria)]
MTDFKAPSYPFSFSNLTLIWADGTTCFENLSGAFSAGLTALIGDNGSGKSSLLKVLAGTLAPTSGTVITPPKVAYLPQDLGLAANTTLAQVFGIEQILTALHKLEDGHYSEDLLEMIGDQWDIAERTISQLAAAGFAPARQADSAELLTRPMGSFSGGGAVTAALTAVLAGNPDVLLLDEPTNNLDSFAKERLLENLASLPCPALVVSHDRQLLAQVDTIAELYAGSLRFFSGNYDAYRQVIDIEQDAAARQLREAKTREKKQKRERIEAETKLARNAQRGKKLEQQKRKPGMAIGNDKMSAEKSAAKLRQTQQGRLDEALLTRQKAEDKLREITSIYLDLPGSQLPTGKRVLGMTRVADSESLPEKIVLQGAERLRVSGANGVGKTTLL